MAEYYKMPVTGKTTTDFDEYYKAWRDLAEPLEKLTGMKMVAFDPDAQFADGKDYISLPVWFVKRFRED